MIKDKFLNLLEKTEKDELFKMFDAMFTDEAMKDCGLRFAGTIKDRLAIDDEQELALFVDNIPNKVLRHGLIKNFTRDMLIEELKTLSENTQECLIKYYQEKNRKIEVLRGIIGINTSNQITVRSPLGIYQIHKDSLLERGFKSDEQVYGVLRNDNFCILEEIELKSGRVLFGYIAANNLGDNTISFREINGFDKGVFNPYNCEYDFGDLLILEKPEIINRH